MGASLGACGVDEDLIAPEAPGVLIVTPTDRVSASIAWEAPADDDGTAVSAYELRISNTPLSAESFATDGTVVATDTPAAPGAADGATLADLRPGTPYYAGLIAIDAAGNRSEPSLAGPFGTSVVQSGSVLPPAPGDDDNAFGYQMEYGDFNDDGLIDIAISAPFKRAGITAGAGAVYLYMGAESGFAASPDIEISGTVEFGQFGNSLAALDWNGDGVSDLAIGTPIGADTVSIFFGNGALGTGPTLTSTDADATIGVDGNSPWFASSALGWSLASGYFDDDDREDLAMGLVTADSGVGALVFLYGGTGAGDISLSEVDAGLMNGAVAEVVFAPGESQGDYALFGSVVENLGAGGAGVSDQVGTAFSQGADAFIIRGRDTRPVEAGVHRLDFDPAIDLRATVDVLDPETYFALSQGAVMDVDGDGVREVALGSYLEGDADGAVTIISGAAVGEQMLSDITIATIAGAAGEQFGSAIVNNAGSAGSADINNDGMEDMIIVGGTAPLALHVWYGGTALDGNLLSLSADYIVGGPGEFSGTIPGIGGTPAAARWAGDTNGDGFQDILWADWANNDRDGAFELIQ